MLKEPYESFDALTYDLALKAEVYLLHCRIFHDEYHASL